MVEPERKNKRAHITVSTLILVDTITVVLLTENFPSLTEKRGLERTFLSCLSSWRPFYTMHNIEQLDSALAFLTNDHDGLHSSHFNTDATSWQQINFIPRLKVKNVTGLISYFYPLLLESNIWWFCMKGCDTIIQRQEKFESLPITMKYKSKS